MCFVKVNWIRSWSYLKAKSNHSLKYIDFINSWVFLGNKTNLTDPIDTNTFIYGTLNFRPLTISISSCVLDCF